MKAKKLVFIVLLIAIIISVAVVMVIGKGKKENNEGKEIKYKVVSSNFASYDFLRAIIGDKSDVELTFLMGPGKDSHSYDPTAQDLIKIKEADLFVYVGGEMEKWSDKVIESLDKKNTDVICISDFVDTIEEKEVDGAEEHEHDHEHGDGEEHEHEDGDEHDEHKDEDKYEHEDKNDDKQKEEAEEYDHEDGEEHEHHKGAFDEHIWTSPENAIKMVNALEKTMEKIDGNNSNKYKENANKYIAQIKDVDSKIKNIVDNKARDRLIFADKMPMQYFIDYYKLQVSAAFDGCSSETEPSAKTIAYLQNKVKEERIPVILYIELNPGSVAKTIADETGAKAMQIQTLHNVSLDDFEKGETWVSLMNRNVDVLKSALQ